MWFDHSPWSKIELAGPEARMFLHNLATNDVKNLTPGAGCEFFLTTNKARVVAHGIANCLTPDLLLLEATPEQGPRILQHLNHYLISEQVELTDRTREWSLLRCTGEDAAVEQMLGVSLADLAPWQHMPIPGQEGFVRREGIMPGVAVVLRPDAARALGLTFADDPAWEILRVESGLPLVGKDMDEQRFVVEVDRIPQAISYAKGCYLGQEPIVMARDRGQVNRLLRGLRIDGPEALEAGTKALAGGVEVGLVTSSVVSPRHGVIALAYLKRGSSEPGTAVTVAGRSAQVVTLPFFR